MEQKTAFKTGKFKSGRCDIIVTIDADRWHLSISTPDASPSYKEIKAARYKYLPNDIHVAQIFPPKELFVNAHPHCHHLWEVQGFEETDKITGESERELQISVGVDKNRIVVAFAEEVQTLALGKADAISFAKMLFSKVSDLVDE